MTQTRVPAVNASSSCLQSMMSRQRKARWHELLVYLSNRPAAFLFLNAVRRLGDVVHVPGVGYFVHHPLIAKAVLDDPNVSNKAIGSYGALFTQVLGEFALFNMEGVEHRQARLLLREFFNGARLEMLMADELHRQVGHLQQLLERGERVDLSDFMHGLSSRLLCRVLGVELSGKDAEEEYKRIYWLCTRLTALAGLVKKQLSKAEVRSAQAIHRSLAAYTRKAYECRALNASSVIGGLQAAGFSYPRIEGLLTVLLLAGTALVTLSIPRILAVLLDSGAFAELVKDPALLERAVEESLRFISPSTVLFRVTTDKTIVEGHRFPRHSRIYVVFYALMKHEEFIPHPHILDIRRCIPKDVKHLWFGAGRHSCLGIALTMKIVYAMLRMLVSLEGNLVVVKRRYGRNLSFPGYQQFWIALRKT